MTAGLAEPVIQQVPANEQDCAKNYQDNFMDSLRRRTADEDKGQRRNENRHDAALLVDSHTPADAGGGKR